MNKRNSIILGLLLLIVVLEIIVLNPREVGIAESEVNAAKPKSTHGRANQIMHDVNLIESKGEKKEWQLAAKKGIQLKESQNWNIENVTVKFFGESGVYYTVTGKRGRVDLKKNDIEISGDVYTRSSNGYIFRTENVFYDSEHRRLMSPNTVNMTGPKDAEGGYFELSGDNMLADMSSNEITLNKNVKGKKTLKNSKTALITSETANFSGHSRSAQFLGNVIIDIDSMRVAGPEAKFLYKPNSDSLDSVEVYGGVKVTDTDKWATSQRVSMHIDEDKFVLGGTPRVVQNGDELRGDEIVFLNGGRKVKVMNARMKFDPDTVGKDIAPPSNEIKAGQ